jgi:hypothetical protein
LRAPISGDGWILAEADIDGVASHRHYRYRPAKVNRKTFIVLKGDLKQIDCRFFLIASKDVNFVFSYFFNLQSLHQLIHKASFYLDATERRGGQYLSTITMTSRFSKNYAIRSKNWMTSEAGAPEFTEAKAVPLKAAPPSQCSI